MDGSKSPEGEQKLERPQVAGADVNWCSLKNSLAVPQKVNAELQCGLASLLLGI